MPILWIAGILCQCSTKATDYVEQSRSERTSLSAGLIFPNFEARILLMCSQVPASGPVPETEESCRHSHTTFSDSF